MTGTTDIAGPVFFFTRFVPTYRKKILAALNERLDSQLRVFSGDPPNTSLGSLVRTEDDAFEHHSIRNLWINGDSIHIQPFRQTFRKFGKPSVVLAEASPRSVTLPRLLRYCQRNEIPTVLWGLFSSRKRTFDPDQNWQDKHFLRLAHSATACACYTDGIADRLRPYIEDERLFVARNTMFMDELESARAACEQEGRAAIRKRLELPVDGPVIVFMGRLIPEKGPDMLLEAFARYNREQSATLVVIGDGEMMGDLKRTASEKSLDVRFTGHLNEEASDWLFASDIMVVPGYLGLVINHAFAFGLPIISQKAPGPAPYHNAEIEYLVDGENGELTEYGDPEKIAAAMKLVLANKERYAASALKTAQEDLKTEIMIDGLEFAIRYAANPDKVRGGMEATA